jgi:hypothetical protein
MEKNKTKIKRLLCPNEGHINKEILEHILIISSVVG